MEGSEAGKVDAAVVVVYEDAGGEFRWTARDTNHEPVADSNEGYSDHASAKQAAVDLFPDAEFKDELAGE